MPRELIHIYRKFGVTFEFSVDNEGALRAQMIEDDKKQDIPFIEGLPTTFKNGISDAIKRVRVKRILENSFFTKIGDTVSVNARLYGGWGDEIHEGSLLSIGPAGQRGTSSRSMLDVAGAPHLVEGAYDWAKNIGFTDDQARRIAVSCVGVDAFWSGTYPVPGIGDQSWHFNTNSAGDDDGTVLDTRIIHAVEELKKAIIEYLKTKSFTPTVFEALGRGLHPLQDVFAHTTIMVRKYLGGIFQEHITVVTKEPDNPLYICDGEDSPLTFIRTGEEQFCSQRYSNTKTATYLYLALFLYSTVYKDGVSVAVDKRLHDLICGIGAGLRIRCDGAGKNAHKFHGLLENIAIYGKSEVIVPVTIRGLFFPPALISPTRGKSRSVLCKWILPAFITESVKAKFVTAAYEACGPLSPDGKRMYPNATPESIDGDENDSSILFAADRLALGLKGDFSRHLGQGLHRLLDAFATFNVKGAAYLYLGLYAINYNSDNIKRPSIRNETMGRPIATIFFGVTELDPDINPISADDSPTSLQACQKVWDLRCSMRSLPGKMPKLQPSPSIHRYIALLHAAQKRGIFIPPELMQLFEDALPTSSPVVHLCDASRLGAQAVSVPVAASEMIAGPSAAVGDHVATEESGNKLSWCSML